MASQKNNIQEPVFQDVYAEAVIVLLLQILEQGSGDSETKVKTKEKIAVLLSKVMPNDRAARIVGMQNKRLYEAIKKVNI